MNVQAKVSYVVCIKNDGYEASLEMLKIYRALDDSKAYGYGLIRVIDESGEDYLYPVEYFVAIELPDMVEKVLAFETTNPVSHSH